MLKRHPLTVKAVVALVLLLTSLGTFGMQLSNVKVNASHQLPNQNLLENSTCVKTSYETKWIKLYNCKNMIQVRQYYNEHDYWSIFLSRDEARFVAAYLAFAWFVPIYDDAPATIKPITHA